MSEKERSGFERRTEEVMTYELWQGSEGRVINFIYRLILTASATSWMIVVYGIKAHWSLCMVPSVVVSVCLLFIPMALSAVSVALTSYLSDDKIKDCVECMIADNDFLPVYLGYFFVALSINDITTLCFVYVIVFVFTFLTQTQYFNPAFLILRYYFYHVTTERGTKVFVIAKGEAIRNVKEADFSSLWRINDTTFITKEDKRK